MAFIEPNWGLSWESVGWHPSVIYICYQSFKGWFSLSLIGCLCAVILFIIYWVWKTY